MKACFAAVSILSLSLFSSVAGAAETPPADNPGDIWWSEYMTADPARTSQFYANVVGWQMKTVSLDEPERAPKPGEKPYIMMMNGEGETAGLMSLNDAEYPGARSGWFTYFYVADLEAALDRAIHQGGRIVREPVEISKDTQVAVIADPEGVLVGLASSK